MPIEGFCLASQQIRKKIIEGSIATRFQNFSLLEEDHKSKKKGWFVDDDLEGLVQPASFEPTIGDEVFTLLETANCDDILSPHGRKSVYRKLLEMPERHRPRQSIDESGVDLLAGFSYLVPLTTRLKTMPDISVGSWPKSSIGRVFLDVQMYADYNEGANFLDFKDYQPNDEMMLWLLLQPRVFNVKVHPGDTLNQLRFYTGDNIYLSPSNIQEEFKKNPLLWTRNEEGLIPAEPRFTNNGLRIHLNLVGKHTEGIVGFMTRENPQPIDLSQKKVLDPFRYFEPLTEEDKKLTIERDGGNKGYLLFTKEMLQIPPHLSAELRQYSNVSGIQALLHMAGFIDPGFWDSDLVFEVMLHEKKRKPLVDGIAIGELDISPVIEIPDKIYGKQSNANYQGQEGPRFPKYCEKKSFKELARKHAKLSKEVLVQDAKVLLCHHDPSKRFQPIEGKRFEALYRDVKTGFFHRRYDCEDDPLTLQPIPYVLLFGPDQTVFSYVRAKDIDDYGDERLFDKHSVGLGGHIRKKDGPDFIRRCIQREVFEEEVHLKGYISEPRFEGTLIAYDKEVDQVHFGLIYTVHTEEEAKPKDRAIGMGEMVSIQQLVEGKHPHQEYDLLPTLKDGVSLRGC